MLKKNCLLYNVQRYCYFYPLFFNKTISVCIYCMVSQVLYWSEEIQDFLYIIKGFDNTMITHTAKVGL